MERDYSDIEVLYGKPIVSFDEVYKFMMDTEEEWAYLGNSICERNYPEEYGLSPEYTDKVSREEYDKLADLESRLYQMCHQLIHDALLMIGKREDDDTYHYDMSGIRNSHIELFTHATEGIVYAKLKEIEVEDDTLDTGLLFELAQGIYHETKK